MSGVLLSVRRPAIAPSILTADFGQLREQIVSAEEAGAGLIHLDVMDGHFVPNISFGPIVVSAVRSMTTLPLDVHLMITNPDRYVDEFVDSGADSVSFHVEATPHPHRLLQRLVSSGVDAGIAINPGTPLVVIEELLEMVDFVLIMSVNPGFGGQAFIEESLGKISRLRDVLKQRNNSNTLIEVDGGINAKNIRSVAHAGADIFVAGSSVFNDKESISAAIDHLLSAVES